MNPTSLPFEYPFQWDNESLREGAGVTPEGAAILKQRDRDLEDFLAGSGGVPTVLVAASDASDRTKAVAHYICDGNGDQEQINSAQQECFELAVAGGYNGSDSNAPGGRVLLSEGTFHISAAIDDRNPEVGTNGPPNMTLQGLGMTATRIKQTGIDFAVITHGVGYRLCDLTIDASAVTDIDKEGGLGVYFSSARCSVERVHFYKVGCQNYGNVDFQDDYGRVQDCRFFDVRRAGAVLFGNNANNNFTIGNMFRNVPLLAVRADGSKTVVANNIIEGSQSSTTDTAAIAVGTNSVVVGNVCESWGGYPATITSGAGSQVASNVLL